MIKYNKQKWGNLMKFFKENSYDIVKLLINQIGIAIFSMTLYFSIALIEDANLKSTLNLLVSIFSTLFYYALIYTAAWEFGAKDKIRIDGGKMEKCSFNMSKNVRLFPVALQWEDTLLFISFLLSQWSNLPYWRYVHFR